MGDPSTSLPATADQAVEILAERLCLRMEHLDPVEDPSWGWADATEDEREFCRQCVKTVLMDRDLAMAAMGS